MRDRLLHDALYTLTEDAADLLDGRLAAGEEIPFEVGEAGDTQTARRGVALYAYRPLTSEFVASHAEQLRSLEAFELAVQNLARTHGAVAYLRARGEPVLEVSAITNARLAVLAFLAAVWTEAESFEHFKDRFGRRYTELESVVLAARLVTTAFIPVYGVVLEAEEVNLGDGVQLVASELLDEECVARFADEPRAADCYCAISIDAPSDARLPVAELRHEARCALTALRMFKPGSVSLGLNAQTEVAGSWRALAMPFSGRAREEAWRLLDGEDDELRQFMTAVRRVERRTRTSWALKRFEMGLERPVPAEGLTDFLAAARALLEVFDDSGRAALPARLAALCAPEDQRERVATAVECAFALERLAVNGSIGKRDRKRLASSPPLETISEVERCLRALLHDLICGYLESDLRKLADEILLADGQPASVEEAIDREAGFSERFYRPAEDLAGPAPGESTGTHEFESVFDDTAEIDAADLRLVDDGPADEWTAAVTGDECRWWSPDDSRAGHEAACGTDEAERAEAEADECAEADAFEQTTQSYPELDAGARMTQLAEELVDGFDRAFVSTMVDGGDLDDPKPPSPAAPLTDRDPEQEARMSFTPPGEADLTFDFPVLAGALEREPVDQPAPDPEAKEPRVRRDDDAGLTAAERIDFIQAHAGLTGDFPVPEFDVPDRVRSERLRELLGDRPGERRNFDQIMNRSYSATDELAESTPEQPQPPGDGDSVNPADFKRPRLIALKGGSGDAPVPLDEPPEVPDVTTAAVSGPATPVVDARETHEADALELEPSWSQPEWVDEAPAEAEAKHEDPVDHGAARSSSLGPATIEFRPLVEPDPDDPDDFAGAV